MNKPKFFIPEPNMEEMEARIAERKADFAARSKRDLFNPTNLGHWIVLCEQASVAYVPAEEIARGTTDDLLRFDEKIPPESVARFFASVESAMAERGKDWMVRWSCCSCEEVKYRLHKGEPEWHQNLVTSFHIGDLRAYDLIYDFPEETIAAYARPWIKAKIVDRYPVEYRIFVTHNQIDGISNYYPQRPLPNEADTLYDITRCYLATVKLIKAQTKTLNCPPLEKHWGVSKNHWTADFIRSSNGSILFLEGGPPHTPSGGAHPCCFPVGKTDGIAFHAAKDDLEKMGLS